MKKMLGNLIGITALLAATIANADGVVVNGYVGEKTTFVNTNGLYLFAAAGFNSASLNKNLVDASLTSAGLSGISSTVTNRPQNAYKFQLGYRFHSNFAVEGGFVDLGKYSYNYSATATIKPNIPLAANISFRTQSWNLSAVGLLPLGNQYTVFGKLGSSSIKTTSDWAGVCANCITRTDVTYGLGLRFDQPDSPGFVRLDWDHYNTGDSGLAEIDTLTLGMGINF